MLSKTTRWENRQAADLNTPQTATRAERMQRIRTIARLMDEAFVIPGTEYRVGLDSLIGLVPVAGDLISTAFSAYIIREAARMGAPKRLLARMTWNAGVDLAAGAIPVAGDVFDVVWKANKKNLRLLERWLAKESRRGGTVSR